MNQEVDYLTEVQTIAYSFAAAICANTLELNRMRIEAIDALKKREPVAGRTAPNPKDEGQIAVELGKVLCERATQIADGFLGMRARLGATYLAWLREQQKKAADAGTADKPSAETGAPLPDTQPASEALPMPEPKEPAA